MSQPVQSRAVKGGGGDMDKLRELTPAEIAEIRISEAQTAFDFEEITLEELALIKYLGYAPWLTTNHPKCLVCGTPIPVGQTVCELDKQLD